MTLPSGETAYIIERRHHQIYRGGETMVSDAMLQDKASWMIEHEVLRHIRKQEIKWVVFFVVDTGDIYTAPRTLWEDSKVCRDMSSTRDTVRHLGLHHMSHRTLPIPLDKVRAVR